MTKPRYQGDVRTCSKCAESKCWPASFNNHRGTICKRCRAEYDVARGKEVRRSSARREAEYRAARRAAQIALRARVRAAQIALRARVRANKPPRGPALFDATLRECERAWGPYARWTTAQHAAHSAILRRLAGIGEDDGLTRRAA